MREIEGQDNPANGPTRPWMGPRIPANWLESHIASRPCRCLWRCRR